VSDNNKIVVIDDEPSVREVVQAYLEKDGYNVFVADRGSEGLSLAERIQPALIVLDLMLPDIPGEELCANVRSRSDMPIVMLTAKASEEERIAGLVSGAVGGGRTIEAARTGTPVRYGVVGSAWTGGRF
jgi:DNA-binding response OmpR family regulator